MATPSNESAVLGTPGIAAVVTPYAKKRRLLREHRRNMCVMDDVIQDNGLREELRDRMVEETGNTNFWLGYQSSMDEGSDGEDPMLPLYQENLRLRQENLQLRQEGRNLEAFVRAARCMQAARSVATDLERTPHVSRGLVCAALPALG